MNLKRILTIVCAVILSASVAFAQSSGDKLYNQGLALQKTMTVSAQNQAISKFSSAKKLYDSAAKKAQCDQAISVSKNIISSLKSGGSGGKSIGGPSKNTTQDNKKTQSSPNLTLSNEGFNIDLNSKTLSVTVNTNQDSWTVAPVSCVDGSSFVTVNKLGNTGFEIVVPQNTSTETRTQKVQVVAGELKREVSVTQTGRPVTIDANKKILKFKEKGGDQKVEISCNSEHIYEKNSNENWYVESMPSWITVTINEKREKGFFAKLKEKGEEVVKGKSLSDNDTKMIKSSISISAEHLVPGTAEAFTGRKGQVVIKSGDSSVTIHVQQLGKDSTVK